MSELHAMTDAELRAALRLIREAPAGMKERLVSRPFERRFVDEMGVLELGRVSMTWKQRRVARDIVGRCHDQLLEYQQALDLVAAGPKAP